MEEVKVFLNINHSKHYFSIEETTGVVQVTTNKNEATFFTLKTTPDLHKSGQFQLVHAAGDLEESRNHNNQIENELVMKLDFGSRHLTQYGPFKLIRNSKDCNDVLHFEIRGRSTSLPHLQR